jgi:hypothetical protein
MLRPKMYMNGHLMVHYQDLVICVDWISKLATTTGHCYIGHKYKRTNNELNKYKRTNNEVHKYKRTNNEVHKYKRTNNELNK